MSNEFRSTQSGLDPGMRETVLGTMLGIKVDNPSRADTVTIAICAAIYGLTAILLTYAWCNYNYRPIRAKNLTWTTMIYIATVLWFVGNCGANGHVVLRGVWSHCKWHLLWFRVYMCFLFSSMTVVRFAALYRVFIQKKPFTHRTSIFALGVVVIVNGIFCLVNQLISGRLTVEYVPSLEVCNVSQGLRIAALCFQWCIWLGVTFLMFRLRNIQSGFNEFHESLLIFGVIIGLLIESSVTNLHYKYYILEQHRRIQKTCVDMAASTLVIWCFIGYPVFQSIFNRHEYEKKWLEAVARGVPNHTYHETKTTEMDNLYSKMTERASYDQGGDRTMLGHSGYLSGSHPFAQPHPPLNIQAVFDRHGGYDDTTLSPSFQHSLHNHQPSPLLASVFAPNYKDPSQGGRHVL
ncbi:hypothetical protein GGF46_002080 [Coemansia sp. RSA 552]|nr:hypothetical protein GGF46_002080 [Coemansia sp. RSA 552]